MNAERPGALRMAALRVYRMLPARLSHLIVHAMQPTFSAGAVASLLAAKGRGRQSPPPVLVGDPAVLLGLGVVPADLRTPYDIREVIARITDGSELDEFKALADKYDATLRITRLRPSGRGADVWDELHPLPEQQRVRCSRSR